MKTFNVNDRVRWSSQAQGSTTVKRGRIVAVVPAVTHPRFILAKAATDYGAAPLKETGWPRNHESYVVVVEQSGSRRGSVKPKLYWPRVSALAHDR